MNHLRQSVLDDGRELLPAVGRKVQQQGATERPSLQPGQDPVSQVQSVGDACRPTEQWSDDTTGACDVHVEGPEERNHEGARSAGDQAPPPTNETEARLGQVRPFKDGVEDVLRSAVQLVQLIQNEKPETQTHVTRPSTLKYDENNKIKSGPL